MSGVTMNGHITAQNFVINVSSDPQQLTDFIIAEGNMKKLDTINGNITAENFVINITLALRRNGDHHTTNTQ